MMGAHHAALGGASWVALTSTVANVPALHLMPLMPGETALGAVLCAGAALLPDADHPQATAAHSAGIASKAATSVVGAISGGHRHGTHAPLVALAVSVGAWLCGRYDLVDTARFSLSWWLCAASIMVLSAFALKVLRIIWSWKVSWLIGVAISAAVCLLWPAFLPLLPAIVAIGVWSHLVSDCATRGGIPAFWPAKIAGPRWVPDWFWGKNGYIALPILGNTGSWREWLVGFPISIYALWGVGASMYALLPR
ncbi:metal-dependent hydrolase [Microbacterium enclense]|uniref:metal-dependent hydrolase n=1 Tax=Microbacterium enclense TaxID=993073 RepID=UPI003F7ED799